MNLEYICSQIIKITHSSICHIHKDGKPGKCFGSHADEQNPVLADTAFREQILSGEPRTYPYIFCEYSTIFYAIFPIESGKLVMGPVSIAIPGKELTDYMLQTHHLSEAGFRLPYCDIKTFGACVLMLHHFLTGEEMSLDELWRKNELQDYDVDETRASVSNVIFQRQEYELPHNPYDQEVRELDSIRRGDVEMLRQSLKETYQGEEGRLSKDQVRQAKNIAICVITLASRAAIEGGMLPEEAFSMVDGYVLQIEEMNSVVKINAMARQAEYEYAKAVAGIHKKRQKNELIERTKNYIFQNLHNEIVIGNIGYEIGVNSSYLSDLFHKIEGMTIQHYIRREKIRMAENMLRYSEYDVKEIANYLSFCSQSYFGHIFKEQTGMSPMQYRKKYGKYKNNRK